MLNYEYSTQGPQRKKCIFLVRHLSISTKDIVVPNLEEKDKKTQGP